MLIKIHDPGQNKVNKTTKLSNAVFSMESFKAKLVWLWWCLVKCPKQLFFDKTVK